jgi:ABC-2 type transport system permease protein
VSAILPLTYAYDALQRVSDDLLDARVVLDVAIVLAATLLALALGAVTLRRRTP